MWIKSVSHEYFSNIYIRIHKYEFSYLMFVGAMAGFRCHAMICGSLASKSLKLSLLLSS